MITFKRLDHLLITIPPGATEQAREFYVGRLQLKELPGNHPHGAIWFELGDIQLHIREEETGCLSARHPAFEVIDLQAASAFLSGLDVEITCSSVIEGRERIFFRDPFGNRIELIEYHKKTV